MYSKRSTGSVHCALKSVRLNKRTPEDPGRAGDESIERTFECLEIRGPQWGRSGDFDRAIGGQMILIGDFWAMICDTGANDFDRSFRGQMILIGVFWAVICDTGANDFDRTQINTPLGASAMELLAASRCSLLPAASCFLLPFLLPASGLQVHMFKNN